ncbi:uncharacterized protein LOC103508462 isoform X1 [Diaphorina citri]|uniref:Uncharacterized protein LOC103508462 isoform X1 n=1 Tax=Diaphorina citri TaxID=121845 RepID=A0A3Q0IWU5_DIACI|nr:uncharacterized protein LOC103508462 isoform X1 [Diaphorina citri]XP_026678865.1 uncharacterized protein LOC103508462 isoform X1 [Diaphorina citri]
MCRAKLLLLLGFTIFGTQANDTPSDYGDYVFSKRHLSSLARDGLIPGKRYVASLIKNVKPPVYYQPQSKKFVHPFHVFQKLDLPEEEKRYIGTVLAKSGHRSYGQDKRSLLDGMIFGEDMRQYLQSNSDKKYDSNFSEDMGVLLGNNRDKKSYGVDGMVFGEDFRRFNPYESTMDEEKRNKLPYPLLRNGKRSYGVDGLIFGEDMRRYLQNPPDEDKRGFNSLMDQMILGEDLRNEDLLEGYGKRSYSLMDGIVFGEDLRDKVLNNYNEKRGHGLMDGMVFAEDLRKAIQEASVRKEKQQMKDEKDMTGQKSYPSKTLSKAGGKRSVQALARDGYLGRTSDQGKRAGVEAMARNGLLKSINGKQGKRAGLEALARNGYLNKCPNNGQSNKRGLSILAKNGLMPKSDSQNKRDPADHNEDYNNLNADDSSAQDYYYNPRPRPYLSYFVNKRPFLGHKISASATTRNIPFIERDVIPSGDKKSYDSEESLQDSDDYDIQKRYVAALLKEASSPAKINIRDVPKSIEEGSEEDVSTEEQNEQSQSKRSYMGENPLNDEFTMPVMQNSASRDVDEVMNELARLSNNNKRYYGSLLQNGWAPRRFSQGRNFAVSKRHIGAMARLGLLPSFRNSRSFYSRYGRSLFCD